MAKQGRYPQGDSYEALATLRITEVRSTGWIATLTASVCQAHLCFGIAEHAKVACAALAPRRLEAESSEHADQCLRTGTSTSSCGPRGRALSCAIQGFPNV